MRISERYDVVRQLGRGAHATTWLAREREGGRMVAVKSLSVRGLPDWRPFELVEREVRALRSVDHPGVPAFIDAFEVDEPDTGPAIAIVTEYVEGPTLLAEIDRGRRWTAAQAQDFTRALLQIVEHLHGLSPRVIHRDIKPANVIVRDDGQPVLIDFGSVRDAATSPTDGAPTVGGTAGYMAPEQAFGIADERSDLHGIGATLVHAFTHVHPSELPRSGLRPQLRELAGIDERLRGVLERLLAPEPEHRFASAGATLRALTAGVLERSEPIGALVPLGATALAAFAATPRTPDAGLAILLDGRDPTGGGGVTIAIIVGGLLISLGLAARAGAVAGAFGMVLALAGALLRSDPNHGAARRMFATGQVALGRILRATGGHGTLHVKYSFDHAGRAYEGSLQIADAVTARTIQPDASLFVFFEPDHPERNVGVLAAELPPCPAPTIP